jgi:histidinol phosphatase-like enzyme
MDFELVLVSNQDGLGTEAYPESTFQPVHKLVMESFSNEGVMFVQSISTGASLMIIFQPETGDWNAYRVSRWQL